MLQRYAAFFACLFVMPNCVWADGQEQVGIKSMTIQEFFPEVSDVQGALVEVIDSEYRGRIAPATWRSVDESSGVMAIARFTVKHLQQKLGILFVLIDENGAVHSRYREIVPYDLPSENFLDSDTLRERFITLQKEYQMIRRQASKNLERRKEQNRKARLEASLGRIAHLAAQNISSESASKGLPDQASHTREVLGILTEKLKTLKAPRGVAIRERRAMSHLEELSRKIMVENTPEIYLDSEGYTVSEKVRLIDENRNEHIFLLEQELARLTKANQ